jgi:hypothetical protein
VLQTQQNVVTASALRGATRQFDRPDYGTDREDIKVLHRLTETYQHLLGAILSTIDLLTAAQSK